MGKQNKLYLNLTLLLALSICFSFIGCKKHTFNDALPKVTIQSVVPYGFDSVIITGKITSVGIGKIDYVGFCYSSSPNPLIIQNQVLKNGTDGAFTAILLAYQDSTYYFKSFAANEFGYAASSVFKYIVPKATPAIAPCTLTNNQINDNGSTFAVSAFGSSTNPPYGNYSVSIYGNEDITICFLNTPQNGIYTTSSDGSNLSANQVLITISNFYQYTINGGQKLYVSLNTNGTTTLSSCGLQYSNGSIATLRGKVTY